MVGITYAGHHERKARRATEGEASVEVGRAASVGRVTLDHYHGPDDHITGSIGNGTADRYALLGMHGKAACHHQQGSDTFSVQFWKEHIF